MCILSFQKTEKTQSVAVKTLIYIDLNTKLLNKSICCIRTAERNPFTIEWSGPSKAVASADLNWKKGKIVLKSETAIRGGWGVVIGVILVILDI